MIVACKICTFLAPVSRFYLVKVRKDTALLRTAGRTAETDCVVVLNRWSYAAKNKEILIEH